MFDEEHIDRDFQSIGDSDHPVPVLLSMLTKMAAPWSYIYKGNLQGARNASLAKNNILQSFTNEVMQRQPTNMRSNMCLALDLDQLPKTNK